MLFLCRVFLLSLAAGLFLTTLSVAAPVVLFDEAHGQQFHIDDSGDLGLSALAELYRGNGFTVNASTEILTKEILSAVDVLVLSGPFLPLNASELDAVISFVAAGGGLAVMLHIAAPVSTLLQQLEVDFTNGVLHESHQVIGGNPLNFKVTSLADHPLTKGLESFSVYGAWALRGTAPQTRIVAETSPYGWVDLNRDKQLSTGDAVQAFGLMAAGEKDLGRYVVIGDDAVFQNRFFDEPNRQLALRLVNWLGSR